MAHTPTTHSESRIVNVARRRRESHEAASDAGNGKRRKVQRACDSCKSRKRKCSGEQPCPLCVSQGLICTYITPHGRHQALQPANGLTVGASNYNLGSDSHPPWPGETLSLSRPGDAFNTNDTSRAASPDGEGITPAGYQGPTSTFSFLRRAWRRFGMAELSDLNPESREEVSIFAYGDRRAPALGDTTELQLPNRDVTSAMTSRYFDFAAPTYRYLHRPTFESWLLRYHEQQDMRQEKLRPIRQAIVLMVLATACLYNVDTISDTPPSTPAESRKAERNDSHLRMGETLYQAAQQKIVSEAGRPCLESVQARLATSLYQLNTSRLNQAWYTLGSTYQLALSIGIHRARAPTSGEPSKIIRECQRRCFWAVHMLDTYLSVMLGRPPYINDAYVDQRYPEIVDDNDLLSAGSITRSIPKDCIQAAPVMHAKLTRIVKEALKEQALSHPARDQHMIATAQRLGLEVEQWQKQLPLFLSGGIHPSSLVPIFRRQLTVLQIGCAHAVMIITRPLLSGQQTEPALMQPHIEKCLSAAKFVLDSVLDLAIDNNLIPAFWNTQYVTFNALTIVYVWIMQRKQGRLSVVSTQYDEASMFELAKSVQAHLARATNTNAPSLRYSIILEELQQELQCILDRPEVNHTRTAVDGFEEDYAQPECADLTLETRQWDGLDMDFPLDPELWMQLDTLLFSTIDSEPLRD
ncbi:hypothetical protein E4T52_09029 [Aureobasidium sp. EXF-3400]|nr:hypothetical protein E4T51_10767 [Aureobasidium sp. EXF-12344]KAI4776024.1 hypothetical protein E4T52_09029 [Aureobasidium sp. EXF-3400]